MGAELRAHDALERLAARPHERDLAHGGDVEVDRLQQVAERLRVLRRDRVQQPDRAERRLLVAILARQCREPQQGERGGRLAGGDRVVLDLLAPGDQLLVVLVGREEPAVLAVGEALEDRVGERLRLGEPPRVERRLVERQQRVEQERVVLEHRPQPRLAAVVGAQEAAVLVAHAGDEEVRAPHRGVAVDGLVERGGGVGERRDHQRVPARQALVVEPGPHPLRTRLVELRAQRVAVRRVGRRAHEDVRALEVAPLGHPEVLDRLIGLVAEHLADLGHGPDVELALYALGVRVERGGERALLLAQLGERPVERLAAHALEQRLAGDLPRVQVRAGEQRIVIEHLLEVRDEPGAVDRVAREAAADLVVHAARGHPAQRVQRHLALAAPEQELDHRGRRELRGAAETPVFRVVELAQRVDGGVERAGVDLLLRRLHRGRAAQALDDRPGLRADLLALLVPRRADRLQHVGQLGIPWRGSGGK